MTAGLGDPVSDTELADRFQRDPEMFTVVYDRYVRDVFRYVGSRLGVQAADDIAAETFLVAFGQRDRFDPSRGNLRPWLFGIATNLVARHRRKEARHYMALARTGAEPPSEGHENRVISAVTAERLQPQLARALTRLSRGERDVILLVALSELSREEVSEALGISYGTVGSRLSRASGHEKILVCGQLAPGARSSVFQSCGHLRSRLLASSLAGLRRVVMHGVPPVWMGLRWFALPISFRRDL